MNDNGVINAYPNEVMQVGSLAHQIVSTRDNPQRYRIYLISGISPALNCARGGGLNPYIVEVEDDLYSI